MAGIGKRRWLGAVSVAALLGAALKALSLAGQAPVRSASLDALPACPGSPNCVSSVDAEDPSHAVAAFAFAGDPSVAVERLKAVVLADGGALAAENGRYLRFEYRSRLFGFVDDVEFLVMPAAGRLDVRSASRVGHSDLGVNRRRVERLRQAWAHADAPTP